MTARRPNRRWVALVVVALLCTLVAQEALAARQVHVRGYYRKDGTYVQPHVRSAPDGNPYNNYSYPGNYNPNTGKVTSGDPDAYLRRYYSKQSSQTHTQAPSSSPTGWRDYDRRRNASPPVWSSASSEYSKKTAVIQEILRRLGFDPGPVDGLMGPHTMLAIMSYQARKGLAIDGIAGPATRKSLLRDLGLRNK
jgi:hypothetical protein